MTKILQIESEIKDIEDECSRRIQAEQNRDQDIHLAQQQKSKLDNDLSLMIKDIGSGWYFMQFVIYIYTSISVRYDLTRVPFYL